MILLVEHQASCASLSWTRQANPGFASRPRVWTNSHRYSTSFRLVPPKGVIALRSPMARQPSNPGPRGRSGTIQLRIASKTEILAPRESPGYRDPWCRANEMAPTMIRTARGASSLLGRWLGSLALAGEILAKGRAPFRSTGEALRYRRHTSDTVGNRDGRREQKPSRQLRLYPVPTSAQGVTARTLGGVVAIRRVKGFVARETGGPALGFSRNQPMCCRDGSARAHGTIRTDHLEQRGTIFWSEEISSWMRDQTLVILLIGNITSRVY